MNYREIIRDAWEAAQSQKRLMWWFAFVPSVLSTIVSIGYLGYQVLAFQSSPFFNSQLQEGEESLLHTILEKTLNYLTHSGSLGLFFIVMAVIFLILYLFLPVFTEGALISLMARLRKGQSVSISQGVGYGFAPFLRLFEYHLIIKTFSFFSIITWALLVIRFFGPEAFSIFFWIFLVFLIASIVIGLLITYSRYYLILEGQGVLESMLSSGRLVLRNLHHTLFMLILMLIISLRVVLNVVLALLVPVLIAIPIFIFSSLTFDTLGIVLGILAGGIALYFAGYFVGIFHLFTTGVWTFTFLELNRELQEDHIQAETRDSVTA